MDAKNKLLIIMLFTSLLGLLYETPLMQAVGGGQHRFINGNNVDCLSCHRNYPDAAHQAGLAGHQMAAENRNYTTYLEIGEQVTTRQVSFIRILTAILMERMMFGHGAVICGYMKTRPNFMTLISIVMGL